MSYIFICKTWQLYFYYLLSLHLIHLKGARGNFVLSSIPRDYARGFQQCNKQYHSFTSVSSGFLKLPRNLTVTSYDAHSALLFSGGRDGLSPSHHGSQPKPLGICTGSDSTTFPQQEDLKFNSHHETKHINHAVQIPSFSPQPDTPESHSWTR